MKIAKRDLYADPVPNQIGPTFTRAPLDSPIRKVVFPLVVVDPELDIATASGTCVRMAPQLALTARHVIVDWMQKHDTSTPLVESKSGIDRDFQAFAIETLDEGRPPALWHVGKIWFAGGAGDHRATETGTGGSDIAVLELEPGNSFAGAQPRDAVPVAGLDLVPPNVGDNVAAFGFHQTTAAVTEGIEETVVHWHVDSATTTGIVTEVLPSGRDASLPWPCFQTTARTRHSMSGGPVFNRGRVCGLVCRGLDEDENALDHVSWMVSLWPAGGIILAGWRPGADSYTLLDAIKDGAVSATGSDRVSITPLANGERHIRFRA